MSESPLWQLLPQLPGSFLHVFEQAYEAHKSAAAILQLANKLLPGMAPEVKEKRKSLLLIPFQIIVAERNKALDEFCAAWIKHRGGALDSTPSAGDVGGGGSEGTQGSVP